MKRLLLLLALALLVPQRAAAQSAPPLEAFVATVARHWADGDASALVDLAPGDGRILLALGNGEAGAVQERHVAAALRDLFGDQETVSARPTQVKRSEGDPLRGFGELSWVSRPRGVTRPVTATVYVGAVYERNAWRIRELRVLR
jgi:hypothetical protein